MDVNPSMSLNNIVTYSFSPPIFASLPCVISCFTTLSGTYLANDLKPVLTLSVASIISFTSVILLLKSMCSFTSKSFNLRISSLTLYNGFLIALVTQNTMGNITENIPMNTNVNLIL